MTVYSLSGHEGLITRSWITVVCHCLHINISMCVSVTVPDYLFWETPVDSADVLLQKGARLSLDLLHFLQTPAGHEQAPSLTVMRQHL